MLRLSLRSRRLVFAASIAAASGVLGAQQVTPGLTAAFTLEQAQAGRSLYDQNCAACHGANLDGSGDAPAIAGGTFILKWRSKMVSELFGEIFQTMPAANPGSLSEGAALNLTAYLLQRNG